MNNNTAPATAPKIIRDLHVKVANLTRRLSDARRERDDLRAFVIDVKTNGLNIDSTLEGAAALSAYKAAENRMKRKAAEVLNSSLE